ncbi:MAG: thioredoxin domain-containing protein, partial [Bacteroidia bacterium]|nr:thioredoxin domain-containing protein [Bacteroidia bacterium]
REERVRPGLDDKILCSWNAMMMTAFLDAWAALGDPSLLDAAQKSADFIRRCFMTADGTLLHSVKETAGVVTSGIPGFLEDYAFTIEAFLRHYSLSMDPDSLQTAERLTAEVLRNFSDEETGMFWFTAAGSETLIARKMEVQDNVIPSSNAVMAHNLVRLSKLKADASLENRCKKMLHMVKEDTTRNTPWYSRWAMVWLELEHGTEVAVSGREALHFLNELQKEYLPLSVLAGATGPSRIPLLADRYHENETGIYVCRYGTCHVPVYDLASALSNLRG